MHRRESDSWASGGRPPAVSVVIPTRNRLAMLQEAVESVRRQSLGDWELIVVDDASEDGTRRWLETWTDRRMRWIRLERHSEQSTTRNTGVKAARAPVVLSLDDDDRLPPDALRTHSKALQDAPEAIASIGGFRAFDGAGAERVGRIVHRTRQRSIWEDVLFGWIAVSGQCAFRRSVLESVGWWNESFVRATDHELWARLSRRGPVVLLPDVVLEYRVHAGQWRPTNLDEIMTRARQEAVEALRGEERARGERLLVARRLAEEAMEQFLEARAWRAFLGYLRVLRRAPELLWSPLSRPKILRPMSRCLVGSRGIRLGRHLLRRIDRRRGRELDFSVRAHRRADARGAPTAGTLERGKE